MDINDRALTIKEVAKFLNISTQMVYNLIKDESLTAFKIGSASRVLYSDLLDFVNRQKASYSRTHFANKNARASLQFQLNDLSMEKGDFKLSGIGFHFPQGKILTLLGPSGSGKTLLLKSIAGLEKITSGSIINGNYRLDLLEPGDRRMGFVFEDYALFPQMDVQGNIEFPLAAKKSKKDPLALDLRLKEMKIDDSYIEKLPRTLPEGIKQLVALARERNNSLDLFLMDEPMTMLDADLHRKIRVFIKKIIGEMGKTTIISSNNPEDALVLSDYLAVIHTGRLLQFGETWDVYHNPTSLEVLETLSIFGVNTLSVRVEKGFVEPFHIACSKEDGDYTLAFRVEDARTSDRGISCALSQECFFDGKKSLYYGTTSEGQKWSLILPKGIKGEQILWPEEFFLY